MPEVQVQQRPEPVLPKLRLFARPSTCPAKCDDHDGGRARIPLLGHVDFARRGYDAGQEVSDDSGRDGGSVGGDGAGVCDREREDVDGGQSDTAFKERAVNRSWWEWLLILVGLGVVVLFGVMGTCSVIAGVRFDPKTSGAPLKEISIGLGVFVLALSGAVLYGVARLIRK